MNAHVGTLSAPRRRQELIHWIKRDFTHAMTLQPNRFDRLSMQGLERLFSLHCLEADRYMLGIRDVHFRPSSQRLKIIAFPEKIDVNPHLHCMLDMSQERWGDRLLLPWQAKFGELWYRLTEGSGSFHIDDKPGTRTASYITKEALRPDQDFLMSWSYHPDRKLPGAYRHPAAPARSHLKRAA